MEEFKHIFKEMLEDGLIEDSHDGDVRFGDNDLGWFITPLAREILENHLKGV